MMKPSTIDQVEGTLREVKGAIKEPAFNPPARRPDTTPAGSMLDAPCIELQSSPGPEAEYYVSGFDFTDPK